MRAFLREAQPMAHREHLESPGVREDRLLPPDEPVQPPQFLYEQVARPQVEMIGIRKRALRPQGNEVRGIKRPHGCRCRDRHKVRGFDLPMGRGDNPHARLPVSVPDLERKTHILSFIFNWKTRSSSFRMSYLMPSYFLLNSPFLKSNFDSSM
jgi:hypothetical protein